MANDDGGDDVSELLQNVDSVRFADAAMRPRDDLIGRSRDVAAAAAGEADAGATPDATASADLSAIFVSDAEMETFMRSTTPWSRLRETFTPDVDGVEPHELVQLKVLSLGCFTLSSMFLTGRKAYEETARYIHRNAPTQYRSRIVAKRRMQDWVYAKSMAYALPRAAGLTAVATGIFFSTHALAAYRGKSSFWEMGAGTATVFGLYRWYSGPKAMLGGAIIGGGMGLLIGSVYFLLLKAGNLTFEVRYRDHVHRNLQKRKQLIYDIQQEPTSIAARNIDNTVN